MTVEKLISNENGQNLKKLVTKLNKITARTDVHNFDE